MTSWLTSFFKIRWQRWALNQQFALGRSKYYPEHKGPMNSQPFSRAPPQQAWHKWLLPSAGEKLIGAAQTLQGTQYGITLAHRIFLSDALLLRNQHWAFSLKLVNCYSAVCSRTLSPWIDKQSRSSCHELQVLAETGAMAKVTHFPQKHFNFWGVICSLAFHTSCRQFVSCLFLLHLFFSHLSLTQTQPKNRKGAGVL